MSYTIADIELQQTCGGCPEQYDAFIGDKQVGYLRLRHGFFRVDYPECGFETIYEANPKGDGIFDSDEREYYLTEAKKRILWRINRPDEPYKEDDLWKEVFENYLDKYCSLDNWSDWEECMKLVKENFTVTRK